MVDPGLDDEDDNKDDGYERVSDVAERAGADNDEPLSLPPKIKTGVHPLTAITTAIIQEDSENHPGSVEGLYSRIVKTKPKNEEVPKKEEVPKVQGVVARLALEIEIKNMEIAHEIKKKEYMRNYWKNGPGG